MDKFKADRSPSVPNSDHLPPSVSTATIQPSADSKSEATLWNSKKFDRNLVSYHEPMSPEAEQFKILRTTLMFPASGTPARTIMVTSALPAEGKSFVSANLAVSIAQDIDRHVLLIDGDIRSPRQHKIFGLSNAQGLSEHLSKAVPLSSLILKTMVEKLSLLPGGTPPHNPAELISSDSMSDLIREVRERYSDRYIVIDTPPPSLTAESAALARQVDNIIVVINSDSTPKKMVEELVEQLGKDKIIGVVMNRFDMQKSRYYGYGKYGAYGLKE